MNYSISQNFTGNRFSALETIQSIFLPNGFRLIKLENDFLQLKGRGMHSTKEDPIRGATEISIDFIGDQIRLEAKLGGVFFMMLFATLFPLLLFGSILVYPYLTAHSEVATTSLGQWTSVGMWIVLGPAMGWWIRRRTINSLHDALDNAILRSGSVS